MADGTFEVVHGGETGRLARRSAPDPSLSLQLLDDSGAVVARGPVERQSRYRGTTELRGTDIERVTGHVVLHPRATTLVVHDGIETLYSAPIAPDAPQIHRLRVHADRDDTWQIDWDAEHSQPLTFDLFFVDPHRRVLAVAKALHEKSFRLDTSTLPGGGDCHVALVATDGIRSQCGRSKPRHLPLRPPVLTILAPANAGVIAAGQPFSLMGNGHDLAGRVLPASGITWSIDGTAVASGQALALGDPLQPGDHTIEMSYSDGEQVVATVRHRITVVAHPSAADARTGDQ